MGYAELADAVVAVHVAYMGFIVIGQLLILVGALCRWKWVRNFWFRLAHLVAIGIVVYEAFQDITCPLTKLEGTLRSWAGEQVSAESFVARFMHFFIVHDWPQWTFDVIHISFGCLILLTFVLARPRWPWVSRQRAEAPALS
jgi:hypothetical protein